MEKFFFPKTIFYLSNDPLSILKKCSLRFKIFIEILINLCCFNQAVKVHDFKSHGKSIWRITRGVLRILKNTRYRISHVLRKNSWVSQKGLKLTKSVTSGVIGVNARSITLFFDHNWVKTMVSNISKGRATYSSVYWARILEQSMGARNRVGIGLSYRPARLHRLAEFIPRSQFLGSLKVWQPTKYKMEKI